jgi:hypothetical protein
MVSGYVVYAFSNRIASRAKAVRFGIGSSAAP